MRFTLALTTVVAVAMAAPLKSIVARKDELTAAIAALAEESPADADVAKSLLDRDLQLTQDEDEEEAFKRDIAATELAEEEEDEEEDEISKRDIAATELAEEEEDEEEDEVSKRDIAATELAEEEEDEEEDEVSKRDTAATEAADDDEEEDEE